MMSGRMFLRRITTMSKGQPAGIFPNNARYKKIQKLQNEFCRDDGLLVWQKLGRDKIFYYFTLFLVVSGFIGPLTLIFKMSFPKRSQD